jgi:hypothetical protein
MATIKNPIPVKMICGVTFAPGVIPGDIIERLESVFSPVEMQSPVFDFSVFTSYYEDEMGKDLSKIFVSFKGLYDPVFLPQSKVETMKLEESMSQNHSRTVNLDPGYITAAKLVLATAKDFAHRIYLGYGIYGDVQLRFRQGRFEPSKWTYPDYQTELAFRFFNEVRHAFMEQEKTDE